MSPDAGGGSTRETLRRPNHDVMNVHASTATPADAALERLRVGDPIAAGGGSAS